MPNSGSGAASGIITYTPSYDDIYSRMEILLYDAFRERAEEFGMLTDPRLELVVGDELDDLLSGSDLQYADLDDPDLTLVNRVIAYKACAKLLAPVNSGGESVTDIVLSKAGNSTTQYAQISNIAIMTERQRWLAEAARLIARISFISDAVKAANTRFDNAQQVGWDVLLTDDAEYTYRPSGYIV